MTVRDNGPRHRQEPDSQHLRQAALRLKVPPAEDEPRSAGHRHLRRRHVRPAHDRQERADHLADGQPPDAHYYELQINTKTNDPQIVKDTTVEVEWAHGTEVQDRTRRDLPEGPCVGR